MNNAYLILTLSALCFGGTWVAGKVAVEAISPMTLAATRFTIASLLLWGWARLQPGGRRRPVRADLPVIIAMGATAVAGYNVLFLHGLRLAPASDGSIIVPAFTPVLTAVLAWLLLGERITAWTIGGLVTALAGLYLVMNPTGAHSTSRLLGDLLFLSERCAGQFTRLSAGRLQRASRR